MIHLLKKGELIVEKFNNLREIIENSAKKYANNIAFRVKKKDENKNVVFFHIIQIFKSEIPD